MFEIRFSDGDEVRNIETYEMALACICGAYPDAVFDGCDSAPHTLCWEHRLVAENDDGSRAIAVITPVPL